MLCFTPPPNIDDCMSNRIVDVPGPYGVQSRALFMETLRGTYVTQNVLYWEGFPAGETSDLYTRVWMKIGDTVNQPDTWWTVWEYKAGPDSDYRQKVEILNNNGTGPRWYVTADANAYQVNGSCALNQPLRILWQRAPNIPVPVNEWFHLEVFSHRHATDGRFWATVNGQVLADYRGPTIGGCQGKITRMMTPVLYTNHRPARQWIDDWELWDGFPCDSPPCGPGRDGGIPTRDDGGTDGGSPDASVDAGGSDGGKADGGGADRPQYRARRVASSYGSLVDGDPQEFKDAPGLELKSSDGKTLARYWVQWNESALYMAAEVTDRLLIARSSARDGPLWDDDSLEVMFDVENNRGAAQLPGNDDYKFFVSLLNVQGDVRGAGMWGTWNSDWQSSVRALGNPNDSNPDVGYSIELRIPWANWGIPPPVVGARWGFDLVLNDARASAADIQRIAWANSTGGTVNDPDGWGELEFGDLDCAADGGCTPQPGNGGDGRDAGDVKVPPPPRGCACGAAEGQGAWWCVWVLFFLAMQALSSRNHPSARLPGGNESSQGSMVSTSLSRSQGIWADR